MHVPRLLTLRSSELYDSESTKRTQHELQLQQERATNAKNTQTIEILRKEMRCVWNAPRTAVRSI